MTNQQKFIDQIAPLAVADMRKNKILASITIAQACLETGCGSSVLMMKYNAVFGIKSTQSWLNSGGKAYSATTGEVINGQNTTIQALFRAYDTLEAAVADHAKVLNLPYYNKSKGGQVPYDIVGETDYKKAAECLLAYATGVNYIKKVIQVIELHKLDKYDNQEENTMTQLYKNHVISTQNEFRTSPFGWRVRNGKDEYHKGVDLVDFDRKEKTSDVFNLAFADGIVVVSKTNSKDCGNYIDIKHDFNGKKFLTRYLHMKDGSLRFSAGQTVKKGDILGIMGTTGDSSGIHLHFQINENSTYQTNGTPVDPEPYLRGEKTFGDFIPPPVAPSEPQIGDPIGDVLYSDIAAYIGGYAIPTSVANNKTLVVVEDLSRYGFDVVWDGKARTLSVERNKDKAVAPLAVEPLPDGIKSGDVKCNYVYTDIKTYLSGEMVESYAIDGVTLIDFELLKKYGNVTWDGDKRELKLILF